MQAFADRVRAAVFGKKPAPAADKWSKGLAAAAAIGRVRKASEPGMSCLEQIARAQTERFEGEHGQVIAIPWFHAEDDTYKCFFCSRVPKGDERLAMTRATGGAGRKLCSSQPRAHFCLKDAQHQQTAFHQHAVKRFVRSPEFQDLCAQYGAGNARIAESGPRGPRELLLPLSADASTDSTCSGSARSVPEY